MTFLHTCFIQILKDSLVPSDLKSVPAGCGGELSGPSGSFNSPDYPSRYPENKECIWYITTSVGSSITLTIHEFDVEFHPDCNYDVLEVRYDPGYLFFSQKNMHHLKKKKKK